MHNLTKHIFKVDVLFQFHLININGINQNIILIYICKGIQLTDRKLKEMC